MVSSVTQNVSKTPGPSCPTQPGAAQAAAQQTACTNPINSGTGGKHQGEADYAGLGVYPLRGERNYDSGAGTPSVIEATVWGSQWRGFYDRSISSINTFATVKRADGKQYYFNLAGTVFVGDADVAGVLTRLGVDAAGNATGWTYKNEQDEVETYDAQGRLTSIANRHGQVQTLTYSDGTSGANGGFVLDATGTATTAILPAGLLIRVSDPAGRTLTYGYDATNRVVKMLDPAGGVYLYTYDPNNNLASVTYPDGKTRQYLYGETANVSSTPNAGVSYTHALTGILDENGTRFASWTYDAAGRATSSEHGAMGSGIDHVGLSYTAPDANGNSTTSVTDVMGVTRSYTFGTYLGVVKNTGITGQPCNGCSSNFSYDPNGNVASRTDFNGNVTCYAYDLARNLETTRLEGLPQGTACPANLTAAPLTGIERRISTQWNTNFRLPAMIAEPLRITSYTYDTQGNLLGKTEQPTTDATGAQGFSATAAGVARTWTYTYNAAGQVLTIDGPRTDVTDITHYAYDAQGNLVTVTDALGHTTSIGGYDPHGRPGFITDPNGLVTALTYDARGRLTSRSAGGETTAYTYDGAGNLTHISLPTGATYTYTYDQAHRLTQIADAANAKLTYTLDNAGNRTREQLYDAAGTQLQTHSRVFDTLNRLVQDIGAVNQTTVYTYDAGGNLLTVTDPLNRQTVNLYDALDRLSQITNPDGGIIHYGYDGLDRLAQLTDPRNLTTRYTRDGLDDLTQVQSPDTGITNASYDAAGNLTSRTDAKGQVATYTYDPLNRITGIVYSGGANPSQTVAYQYDQGANGIGHLTQITDATGIVGYTYDPHGRLTSETAQEYGAVYTTGYGYDPQGRLATMTYPSGRTLDYTFDGQGRINSISTTWNGKTTVLASAIAYRPFGGVAGFIYGDGTTAPLQTYSRQIDQDGRIAGYSQNGQTTILGYDAASQIVSRSDPANPANAASYNYDPMSRLTGFIQGTTGQSYNYDLDGNRVSQIIGTVTTTYNYGTANNWLTGIQVGAGAPQAVSHDPNGATTADAANQYRYDLRGRLIQSITALGVVNYEINALGLRVRKQVPYANTDTLFHYDTEGHLIAEHENGAATYTREYVYLGDQPIAVLQ